MEVGRLREILYGKVPSMLARVEGMIFLAGFAALLLLFLVYLLAYVFSTVFTINMHFFVIIEGKKVTNLSYHHQE